MKRSQARSTARPTKRGRAKRTAAEQRVFLDRLEASMTDEVMERSYRYAHKRVQLLARCGIPIERELAKHLLADAVSDTALGDARWDPDRCELYVHLCSVIRYRTKDLLRRAMKYPHERLVGKDDYGVEAEGLAGEPERTVEKVVVADLATQVSAALYASADMNADPIVRRILDAYAAGVTGRREVAEHAGVSLKHYDAARNRLDRMVKKLPEQLAADAAESMGVRR